MVLVVVQVQLLAPNRDLAHGLVLLLEVAAVPRPHVQREVAELARHLELEQFVEEGAQRALLNGAVDLLLVQGDRAVHVPLAGRGGRGATVCIAARAIVATAQQVLGITWRNGWEEEGMGVGVIRSGFYIKNGQCDSDGAAMII